MTLPPGFQFSQASLQDYADCPRRFQLRYLLKIAWPAVQSEPLQEHERFMRQGERFHRLVQQYFLGLPPEMLAAQTKDPDLALWWENFLQFNRDFSQVRCQTRGHCRRSRCPCRLPGTAWRLNSTCCSI